MTVPTPTKSLREQLFAHILASAPYGSIGVHDTWRKIYTEFEKRTNRPWRQEAAKNCETNLDYIENQDGMEQLLAVAVEFLAPKMVR